MTSSREAAVRAAYECDLADFDDGRAILDPEVEWQTNWPGLAPAVHGIEGVRRWAQEFMGPWESVERDVREVIDVNDTTVFVWTRLSARGRDSGVNVTMDTYDVLTLRDGRVVLRRTWPERAPAAAAAGIE